MTRAPPSARPKVRIEEVARAAKVSAATVSRALNNPGLVSFALRTKVDTAAQALGYVAHGAARALASRRSRALGALVPTFANTIFSDAISAFQRRLEAANYTMLLAAFDYDPEVEYRSARTMIERGVDGLMLVGVTHDPRLFALLDASGVPFVQTWAPAKASPHPTIGYDNAALTRMVVDHLVSLGHRDIGMVAGVTEHNDRVRARIAGMRATLQLHSLPFEERRMVFTEYRLGAVRDAFREMQGRGPLPTALVANNDIVAIGLLLEAQAQGIAVPRDLSVVGVGDLEIAAHLQPGLTTVRTPKHSIGTLAAEYLLARIDDRAVSLPAELALELIIRGTTAPPPDRRKDPSP
ncbi:LacI family DNA-binding transcriptional regulator [Plastoroseomonas arctica]|uniref:Substrate-binding domain-containing protein n=1 Tax=Plastoroseomonas arctica TaxID=1509237 RepID=A0AAF1K4L4_9PROT|nr:substrate-binding domain-containing protein [Plastoroseomonas arctica]MBR0656151.1 substrate-binding domain-containing protein [Plastoroseomonas arctica]